MAFHFTLNADGPLLEMAENADENVAFFDIGYTDEGSSFKVQVALSSVPAMPASHREVHFLIIETNDSHEPRVHKNGRSTKEFLQGDDRMTVLVAIANTIGWLATRAKCEVLSISTIETNLPQKALSKYGVICKRLVDYGYHGKHVDSYHGSEQWLLRKN